MFYDKKDPQAQNLYKWEWQFLDPKFSKNKRHLLSFPQIGRYVKKIWKEEGGLGKPPFLGKLPKNWTGALGTGDRYELAFHENLLTCRYIVLHELSHCLIYNYAPGKEHGPDFVGVYTTLLEKYMGIKKEILYESLDSHGILYNREATFHRNSLALCYVLRDPATELYWSKVGKQMVWSKNPIIYSRLSFARNAISQSINKKDKAIWESVEILECDFIEVSSLPWRKVS